MRFILLLIVLLGGCARQQVQIQYTAVTDVDPVSESTVYITAIDSRNTIVYRCIHTNCEAIQTLPRVVITREQNANSSEISGF